MSNPKSKTKNWKKSSVKNGSFNVAWNPHNCLIKCWSFWRNYNSIENYFLCKLLPGRNYVCNRYKIETILCTICNLTKLKQKKQAKMKTNNIGFYKQ